MCSSIKNAPHIVLLLVSVAATPPFMFLIVRKNFIFQPTIIPPIPSSYPGNSPVFILVPHFPPAINPPSPIPHPICSSIHQSHQSLGPDLCVATFPHPLLPLPLPINPYMLPSIPIHIWDPSRPIPARPLPASQPYEPAKMVYLTRAGN